MAEPQPYTIMIDPDLLHGNTPVAFRGAKHDERFITPYGDDETAACNFTVPRLIVEPPQKKSRQYNADEMAALVGRTLIADGNHWLVVAFRSESKKISIGSGAYSATELQDSFTHLDGTKCEVAE